MLKCTLTLYDTTTTSWSHRNLNGSEDLINTLKKHTISDNCNRVIFCPRNQSTGGMNGKYQTNSECNMIQDIIRGSIKDSHLQLSTFNPVIDSGYQPVKDQRNLFHNAHTVIGLKGSAIHNIIWSSRFVDSGRKPLNIIEIIPCNDRLNDIITPRSNERLYGDYRNRVGDALGSYAQYSDEFNGRWHHVFYNVKENSDFVYTDLKSLHKLILNTIN